MMDMAVASLSIAVSVLALTLGLVAVYALRLRPQRDDSFIHSMVQGHFWAMDEGRRQQQSLLDGRPADFPGLSRPRGDTNGESAIPGAGMDQLLPGEETIGGNP